MLNNILFNRNVTHDLEKSMDAYSLRQKVISNNIANVMTPGYKAQKVSFEEEYRKTLYPDPQPSLRLNRTHEAHMQIGNQFTISKVNPRVEYKDSPMNDSGLNNVDIDREMAEMAENSLRYEMSTKLANKKFNGIRNAVRGRA